MSIAKAGWRSAVVAKPCCTALLRTRSLPRAVRGPVLRLAFLRLAASLRSEVIFRGARRIRAGWALVRSRVSRKTGVTGMSSPGEEPLRLGWLFGRARHLGGSHCGNRPFSGQAFGRERRRLGALERERSLDDGRGGDCRFSSLRSRDFRLHWLDFRSFARERHVD